MSTFWHIANNTFDLFTHLGATLGGMLGGALGALGFALLVVVVPLKALAVIRRALRRVFRKKGVYTPS
jgi:hypothetical protein